MSVQELAFWVAYHTPVVNVASVLKHWLKNAQIWGSKATNWTATLAQFQNKGLWKIRWRNIRSCTHSGKFFHTSDKFESYRWTHGSTFTLFSIFPSALSSTLSLVFLRLNNSSECQLQNCINWRMLFSFHRPPPKEGLIWTNCHKMSD